MPFFALLLLLTPIALQAGAGSEKLCRQLPEIYSEAQTVLWQDLDTLSADAMQGRKSGTEGARLAREYIVKRFQDANLRPLEVLQNGQQSHVWLHTFSPPGLFSEDNGANVVGMLKGNSVPHKYIVITAHYDHLGKEGRHIFNGANDNATGVAAMLYIAQQLATAQLRHSLIFVATDFEEAGLYGATAFVEDKIVAHEDIALNINLDMLGQPGRDWTVYIAGTRWQPHLTPLLRPVVKSSPVCVELGLDKITRSYDRKYRVDWRKASDHWAFAQQGIPWLYIGVKDYRYYHTAKDVPDKLSRPFYTGVAETALMTVKAMDQQLSAP